MSELHGFRRGKEVIYITHLPNRKRPVLLIGHGYIVKKIASFDSEGEAKDFCKMLERWFGTSGEETK